MAPGKGFSGGIKPPFEPLRRKAPPAVFWTPYYTSRGRHITALSPRRLVLLELVAIYKSAFNHLECTKNARRMLRVYKEKEG